RSAQFCMLCSGYVACIAPWASGYERPACFPFAPGSQPSRWSKLRFSIISMTTVSNGASWGAGSVGGVVVVATGAVADFADDGRAAAASPSAPAPARPRNSRRPYARIRSGPAERHLADEHGLARNRARKEREVVPDLGDVEEHALQRGC